MKQPSRHQIWATKRKAKGARVVSISFKPALRLKLTKMARAHGLSETEMIRHLVAVAGAELPENQATAPPALWPSNESPSR